MADDNRVPRVDPGLVTEIVSSYVARNRIAVDQIGNVIATVHQTLSGLGANTPAPAPATERLTPAVPIRRSVHPEYVVCLECGFRAQILRRHLQSMHSLDAAAYRARWKLPSDHPLTAPAYSAQRAAMAKQHGLGRRAVDEPPAHQNTSAYGTRADD
jgi:predicted transcriptional regulator